MTVQKHRQLTRSAISITGSEPACAYRICFLDRLTTVSVLRLIFFACFFMVAGVWDFYFWMV
jgi:hypothetical protein